MAILSSIFLLRDRLAQISFLFRENAADLYPRKIFRLPRDSLVSRSRMPRRRLEKSRRSTNVRRRLPFDKLDVEDFPEQLDLFSRALSKFLYNLNEFPEFTDKSVDAPIMAFEDDLKVNSLLPTLGFQDLSDLQLLLVLGFLPNIIRRYFLTSDPYESTLIDRKANLKAPQFNATSWS